VAPLAQAFANAAQMVAVRVTNPFLVAPNELDTAE